jgi:hypothetical protein
MDFNSKVKIMSSLYHGAVDFVPEEFFVDFQNECELCGFILKGEAKATSHGKAIINTAWEALNILLDIDPDTKTIDKWLAALA